jgi:membrane-bound lytic murein transglycosylase A
MNPSSLSFFRARSRRIMPGLATATATATAIAIALALSACIVTTTPPKPPPPAGRPAPDTCPECTWMPPAGEAPPENVTSSVAPGMYWRAVRWESLPGWREDSAGEAWPAFRESCRMLVRKAGWQAVCADAHALPESLSDAEARRFFETRFFPWRAQGGDGSTTGVVTGYYEPLIRGSRTRTTTAAWPIFATPDDLVVPYRTRAEIERLSSVGRFPARVLLWADDPIELFFLQVQGSGQVELPDGSRVRLGFANHNGQPYRSIGTWLIRQGELTSEQASMASIQQWARSHPKRLNELLNANPRYIFFRILPQGDGGPLGALGVPLSAGRSIAVDPANIPLGAPVFLATTQPLSEEPLNRLVMAQDTGTAIKGAVRADFFWGFGPEAGAQAGRMKQQGRMWVLLPKATAGHSAAHDSR